jgi:hypothetical protein
MDLTTKTARNYLDRIFTKLKVHTRTEAALLYVRFSESSRQTSHVLFTISGSVACRYAVAICTWTAGRTWDSFIALSSLDSSASSFVAKNSPASLFRFG